MFKSLPLNKSSRNPLILPVTTQIQRLYCSWSSGMAAGGSWNILSTNVRAASDIFWATCDCYRNSCILTVQLKWLTQHLHQAAYLFITEITGPPSATSCCRSADIFLFFVWIKNVLTYHYEWSTVVQQNRHALQILFSRCKGACLFSVVGYLILKRREAGCCFLLFCHVHCEGILLCQAMEV